MFRSFSLINLFIDSNNKSVEYLCLKIHGAVGGFLISFNNIPFFPLISLDFLLFGFLKLLVNLYILLFDLSKITCLQYGIIRWHF